MKPSIESYLNKIKTFRSVAVYVPKDLVRELKKELDAEGVDYVVSRPDHLTHFEVFKGV